MISKTVIEGYESFCKFVENLKEDKGQVYFMFSGSKDSTGESWCPDCVKATPIVDKALEEIPQDDVHYVYVGVGERSVWKDPNCPFRTDKRLMLRSVPTLLKWGHPDKLEDAECTNPDLVSMMFE